MNDSERGIFLCLILFLCLAGIALKAQSDRYTELVQDYEANKKELLETRIKDASLKRDYELACGEISNFRADIVDLEYQLDLHEQYELLWRGYRERYKETLYELACVNYTFDQDSINNLTFHVEPRKEVFLLGNAVTFNIESEKPLYGSYFTIKDPTGKIWWEGDPLSEWFLVDDHWVSPYYGQTSLLDPMLLHSRAPIVGNWTWVYTFGETTLVTGSFIVEKPIGYEVIG